MRRVLPLLIVVLCVGCSKSSTASATKSTTTPTQAAAAAPAQAQEPPAKPVPAQLPDVVARVNGESIPKSDLEKAVQGVEQQNGAPVPAEQRDRVYRGVLDQLIGYRLLIQETKARKMTVADKDVDARVDQLKSQFPSEDAFKQALDQQKVTLAELRSQARSDMLVTEILRSEVEPKVAVKPEQVNDFYQKNTDKFQQGERARASHILISFPQNADAAAKQATKTKAEAVLKDLKSGKDFSALAKQYSQDPASAQNGGDLDYFEKGQMVPQFDQAVFSMKPGQMSDLVETQFGYHIIKVTDRQPSRTVPLDEVKAQIQQYLENQNRQEATQAFVATLRGKGKVEIPF